MDLFNKESPVYIQLVNYLEDEILSGAIKRGERIYSQNELAKIFFINPATAAKSLTILVEGGILVKRRGLGMFVTDEALELIEKRRKSYGLKSKITELVIECKKLNITEEELLKQISSEYNMLQEPNDSSN